MELVSVTPYTRIQWRILYIVKGKQEKAISNDYMNLLTFYDNAVDQDPSS